MAATKELQLLKTEPEALAYDRPFTDEEKSTQEVSHESIPPWYPQIGDILANCIKYNAYEDIVGEYWFGDRMSPEQFWEALIWNYFCFALYGSSERRSNDALKELDSDDGLGYLPFGVRCVLCIAVPSKPGRRSRIQKIRFGKLAKSEKVWNESADFMLKFLMRLRTKQGKREAVYGAVAVGNHVRFYALEHEADVLKTLGRSSAPLHVWENQQAVHRTLTYIAGGCRKKFAGNGDQMQDSNVTTTSNSSMCRWRSRNGLFFSCRCNGYEPEKHERVNLETCYNCDHDRSCHRMFHTDNTQTCDGAK